LSKVLVTGGAGFIGSNLVDRLTTEGHDIVVIDNESSDVNEEFYWNSKANNLKLDIRNFDSISKHFKNIEYVFHLAAQSRIQPSILEPLKTLETNIIGTANVLEASRLSNVKRVIYSTTSSYYGLRNSVPNVETQPEDCLNPYSLAKVTGDKLCKIYSQLYGIETISLRYFCVYGPREPLKGEYAPVIGLFLRQNHEKKPLTVVGDGSQIRDFTHVQDVVDANILMISSNLVKSGEVYNVGSGKSYSILDIAKSISGDITYLPARPAEAKESMANIDKIRQDYGWQPKMDLLKYIADSL
jgi:UDP-glucose 4-epimerase